MFLSEGEPRTNKKNSENSVNWQIEEKKGLTTYLTQFYNFEDGADLNEILLIYQANPSYCTDRIYEQVVRPLNLRSMTNLHLSASC